MFFFFLFFREFGQQSRLASCPSNKKKLRDGFECMRVAVAKKGQKKMGEGRKLDENAKKTLP